MLYREKDLQSEHLLICSSAAAEDDDACDDKEVWRISPTVGIIIIQWHRMLCSSRCLCVFYCGWLSFNPIPSCETISVAYYLPPSTESFSSASSNNNARIPKMRRLNCAAPETTGSEQQAMMVGWSETKRVIPVIVRSVVVVWRMMRWFLHYLRHTSGASGPRVYGHMSRIRPVQNATVHDLWIETWRVKGNI